MALTERGWLRDLTPTTAIGLLPEARPRQWRLFACACVRLCWDHLTHPAGRRAVVALEALCDRRVQRAELTAAVGEVNEAMLALPPGVRPGPSEWALSAARFLATPQFRWAAARTCDTVVQCLAMAEPVRKRDRQADYDHAHRAVRAVMHDVFGNPFRPVAFVQKWRTVDTVGLARGIYEDRDFRRLGLLRDALMDAGCDDDVVLQHTRQRRHVRGCWLIDLLLGKS